MIAGEGGIVLSNQTVTPDLAAEAGREGWSNNLTPSPKGLTLQSLQKMTQK